MGRKPLGEAIDQQIDDGWVQEIAAAQKEERKPRAVKVWRTLHGNPKSNPSMHNQIASLSYVEKRIRKNPGPGVEGLPVLKDWEPWVTAEESPEDRAFLLRLHAVKLVETNSWLLEHEAEWGRKLRVALEGLSPYGQWRIVELYANREVSSGYYGKGPPFTGDLDPLLAYQPWIPNHWMPYGLAVASGNVPIPLLGFLAKVDSGSPVPFELAAPPEEEKEILLEQPDELRAVWEYVKSWLTPTGTEVVERRYEIEKQSVEPTEGRMLDQLLDFWANPEGTSKEGGSK